METNQIKQGRVTRWERTYFGLAAWTFVIGAVCALITMAEGGHWTHRPLPVTAGVALGCAAGFALFSLLYALLRVCDGHRVWKHPFKWGFAYLAFGFTLLGVGAATSGATVNAPNLKPGAVFAIGLGAYLAALGVVLLAGRSFEVTLGRAIGEALTPVPSVTELVLHHQTVYGRFPNEEELAFIQAYQADLVRNRNENAVAAGLGGFFLYEGIKRF